MHVVCVHACGVCVVCACGVRACGAVCAVCGVCVHACGVWCACMWCGVCCVVCVCMRVVCGVWRVLCVVCVCVRCVCVYTATYITLLHVIYVQFTLLAVNTLAIYCIAWQEYK